jgi:glycosyltransferase involved in cell wall biosynthesis
MSLQKSNILIILPTYNEAEVIGEVLLGVQKDGYTNICLIDDGSSDNTNEIAQAYNIKILTHPINLGAGAAIQTGIAYARSQDIQYALLMDSDGQHLPDDIERLYQTMQETDADIVIGNRFSLIENDVPKHRIAYNQLANIFTNFFCKKNYPDTQSGFRLLNRKAIEKINLKNRGFGFCSEMIIMSERLNLHIEQTPIKVLYTDYSLNKGQNLREGIRTARSILWRVFLE